jgi:hypothetical protein
VPKINISSNAMFSVVSWAKKKVLILVYVLKFVIGTGKLVKGRNSERKEDNYWQ